ncbi:MAG TPA: threonine/serine exporter family protein, partial [Gemmatimonadales bacterium]|nr:threonine/serine exporter family protein [Gemmatimonadales bacterium]
MALTLKERSQFVLAFARVLFVDGQSTAHTVAAAERLAGILDLRAQLLVRWGELQLVAEDGDATLVCATEADPAGVDMTRVTSAMRALDDLDAGRLTPSAAIERVGSISQAPPGPTWLFALAAGAGAAALSVIFGVQHLPAAALIFFSAAGGGVLRRSLAPLSANVFLQPFCAALLAGVIGALAVRYELSSSLRLVAVCPCMVLVPGPHLLNGAMDLIEARIHLGATRLIYAGVVLVAIAVGLLIGLALLGVSLPVGPPGRTVPLWEDIIAAGVAVAAYSVFFNTPLYMLPAPVAVGMVAHAIRWGALVVLGASAAIGAMVACVIVGLIIT